MNTKYILSDRVMFSPAENKLTPLGPRGSEVILHAPVSRFLLLLLQRHGAIVLQDEIYREVWEKLGQRVAPNTLYQNVSLLRKALKKAGVVTLTIRTYPKAGFSFKGPIQIYEESDDLYEDDSLPVTNKTDSEVITAPDILRTEEQAKSEGLEDNQRGQTGRQINTAVILRAIIILLVATLCFVMFIVPSSTDEKFTAEQEIVARVNGCPVYVDRGNKKVELSKILAYLREKEVRCVEHEFLYLTKTPNQEDVMVMTCNSDDQDLKCARIMKLPLYLTPKPKPNK